MTTPADWIVCVIVVVVVLVSLGIIYASYESGRVPTAMGLLDDDDWKGD